MTIVIDPWHITTYLGAIVCLLYVLRAPLLLYIPIAYFLFYALGSAMLLPQTVSVNELVTKLLAARFFISIGLIWLFFKKSTWLSRAILLRVSLFAILLDAFWLLDGGEGMFIGNTQDTIVMAAMLPLFALDKHLRWTIPFLFFAIFKIFGAGSFVVLAFEFFFFLFLLPWYYALMGGGVGLLLVLWGFHTPDMHGERWHAVWAEYFDTWLDKANLLVGFGPGSFEWLSAALPHHELGHKVYWAHGDWFQILIETGIIGLVLALWFWLVVAHGLKGKFFYLGTWIAFGIAALVYSPFQFFFCQMVLGFLIFESVKNGKNGTATRD